MNIIIGSATHVVVLNCCFNAHPLIGYLVQCVCINVCMCMDRCVSVCVWEGVRGDGRYVVCVCVSVSRWVSVS